MHKLAAVLLCCLAMTGCASSWDGKLRYKIVSVDNTNVTEMFKLELVGEAPKGVLGEEKLSPQYINPSTVSGGAAVGDEVLCDTTQKSGAWYEDSNVKTSVKSCERA